MSTVTKSQAIKKFLTNCARPELAELYHLGMECQVNVRQGCGEVITGDYLGKRWRGFTDGLVTWKPIRIPFKAFDNPEWTDTPMSFPLDVHVDGIGMTGWNWQDRESIWFAYDFDGMVGHSEKHLAKLTDEEMEEVKRKACELDYVEVRKSSSGTGLHLYVY
ncbi:MAG: hypothetical protein GY772_21860, partial [bacterium]|nr:hypothetical protein [bacterium]